MSRGNRQFPERRVGLLAVLTVGLLAVGTGAAADNLELDWNFDVADPPRLSMPSAGTGQFPVEFIVDDGTVEGDFGVGSTNAQQFMWFNRFTSVSTNFQLVEVDVLFPPAPNLPVGGEIQLLIYLDPDGDPTTGAELLASYDDVVQSVDGLTFSTYVLDPPIDVQVAGDLLVAVIARFVESGVSPPVSPAALDTTATQGRSWIATWVGDPPADAPLPPDAILIPIDDLLPGNFMIRAFGAPLPIAQVPALGPLGMILLCALLGLAGFFVLFRRRAL